MARVRPKIRGKRIPALKSPIRDEQRYEVSIKLIVNDLKKLVRKHINPILESVTNKISERVDDEASDITTAIGKIRSTFEKRFPNKAYEKSAKESAARISKTNTQNNTLLMTTLVNIDPIKFEPWLKSEINLFVKSNASLIKSLPTEALSDIEQMLFREGRRGLSPQQLKKKIKEIFDTTASKAALIARDQVNKFNSSLTELRQTKAGITEYEWLTSQDGRVRSFSNSGGFSDHARLNGTTHSWNKPPITVFKGKRSGERNHPGQDIQCRCQAIPVIKKRK